MTAVVRDTVTLLPDTAEALSELGFGEFYPVETPERMAWVVKVLWGLDDEPRTFPHGKSGTCQSIEEQVQAAALDVAKNLNDLKARV